MKKIAIDVRPLARSRSGIRRYLENVAEYLLEIPDIEWYLYSDKPLLSNVVKPHHRAVIKIAGSGPLAKLIWPWKLRNWIKQDLPDTYWSPRHHLPGSLPIKTQKVVTIHDLVWVNLPETMRTASLLAERLFTPSSLKAADVIVAVSESTAEDIRTFSPEIQGQIHVIPHGRSSLSCLPKDESTNSETAYFLSVGTIEPRKNFETLLEGYSEYLQGGGNADLVIAGNRGWGWRSFQKKLSELNLQKKVRFYENCDDQILSNLYRNAVAFVTTSLGEGYGLPVSEAAEFGLPMVLSDLAVFRELQPSNVVWVDPGHPKEISDALFRVEQLSEDVNRAGYRPSTETDDWKTVAVKLFKLF